LRSSEKGYVSVSIGSVRDEERRFERKSSRTTSMAAHHKPHYCFLNGK